MVFACLYILQTALTKLLLNLKKTYLQGGSYRSNVHNEFKIEIVLRVTNAFITGGRKKTSYNSSQSLYHQ